MYLKKIEGPRSVTLPDGKIMTRADLPDPKTKRWVASRKNAVVEAVSFGLITPQHAIEMYSLSEDELNSWENSSKKYGIEGLKSTNTRKFEK